MRWNTISQLALEEFRRLTGVKKPTFDKMVQVLQTVREAKQARGGRRPKISVEDTLLMALEYLREYRTYFHISKSYGISEGYAYKLIRWVEDTLIKSKVFSLPGRKTLLKSEVAYDIVLVDASESPIQRPKKNSINSTQARKKDTL
jgi:Helix-turn-helix of DDE superfamily endonuclease